MNDLHRLSLGSFLTGAVLTSSGCGHADAEPTITQGVYGTLVLGCDAPGCSSSRIAGARVSALPAAVGLTERSAISDDDGFYEIALDPGEYVLLLDELGAEQPLALGAGVTRCDWVSGPGGGDWSCSKE